MDVEAILHIGREALMLTLLLSAIPVFIGMIVGIVGGIFQAATHIQESTLTAAPKIVAVFVALMVAGPWMIRELVRFATLLFERIG